MGDIVSHDFGVQTGAVLIKFTLPQAMDCLEERYKNPQDKCVLSACLRNELLRRYAQLKPDLRERLEKHVEVYGTRKNQKEIARRGKKVGKT